MTSHHHRAPDVKRVLVDGRDVTNDCEAFDDRYGWAVVFTRNGRGERFGDPRTRRIAREVLVGVVSVELT